MWLRYMNVIFKTEKLKKFSDNIKSKYVKILIIIEMEQNYDHPFLNVVIMKKVNRHIVHYYTTISASSGTTRISSKNRSNQSTETSRYRTVMKKLKIVKAPLIQNDFSYNNIRKQRKIKRTIPVECTNKKICTIILSIKTKIPQIKEYTKLLAMTSLLLDKRI